MKTAAQPMETGRLDADGRLGYSLLRLTLGVNIALHGISRLMAGPGAFAASLAMTFHNTVLPVSLVRLFGYVLPWAESIIGLLVLLGLCTRSALLGGGALILLLTFGSTLHQDWDAASVQLEYAVVFAVLIAFRRWNAFCLDGLWPASAVARSSH